MRFIFLHLILSSTAVSAQPSNLDSLWNAWNDNAIPDTNRAVALQQYTWNKYLFVYPDSALVLGKIMQGFCSEINYTRGVGMAKNLLGIANHILGNFDTAIAEYKESIELSEAINNLHGVARSSHNLAMLYGDLGNETEALEIYKKCVRIDTKLGNYKVLAGTLTSIGNVYAGLGDYKRAIQSFDQSLELSENKKDIAITMGSKAQTMNKMGNYKEANQLLKYAIMAFDSLGDDRLLALAYSEMAGLLINQGNNDKAIEFQEKALELRKKMGAKRGIATSIMNLGAAHYNLNNFQIAIELFEESLTISRAIRDELMIGSTMNFLAFTLVEIGRYDKAKPYIDSSYNILTSLHNEERIVKCLNTQFLYWYKTEALDSAKAIAFEYVRRAEAANLNLEMENGYLNLFKVHHRLKSYSIAEENLSKLIGLQNVHMDDNFPILPETEKEVFVQNREDKYEIVNDYIGSNPAHRPEIRAIAFDNALRIKGVLLKSMTAMKNYIYLSEDSTLINGYDQWLQLKRRIAESFSEGIGDSALESEAKELETTLASKSNEFASLLNSARTSWIDVKDRLKKTEAAIEIVRFNAKLMNNKMDSIKVFYGALIIVKKLKFPVFVKLCDESELQAVLGKISGTNFSYIEEVYGTKETTKSQLYDLIWKPMEKELKGIKKVYVSAVGLLHKISFAALAKEQDVYLCGKLAMPSDIAYDENSSTTLFGGIDYNSDSTTSEIWSYLDGSLSETQQIETVLKKNNREYQYFSQKDATEAQFKEIASNSNILHIATHGFFYQDPDLVFEGSIDEEESETDLVFRGGRTGMGMETFVKSRNPLMRSGLAFAGANDVWSRTDIDGEDGVLTAAEVATIDMRNTELVVLSACETGLGDIKGSEGVYGLQRSFKMAGVKYIIMSLWQVPDKETAEFMTSFYKNLTESNDIKNSFNKTQREMREKYDPYYWAAFVLIE
jgi:CHAT domain-containing protein